MNIFEPKAHQAVTFRCWLHFMLLRRDWMKHTVMYLTVWDGSPSTGEFDIKALHIPGLKKQPPHTAGQALHP